VGEGVRERERESERERVGVGEGVRERERERERRAAAVRECQDASIVYQTRPRQTQTDREKQTMLN
jgi:hypothetical protein